MIDTIRHFTNYCTSTFHLRDTFLTKLIDYYGVQTYVVPENLSEEDFVKTLFKGNHEKLYFENETIHQEFISAFYLRKAANVYFDNDNRIYVHRIRDIVVTTTKTT